MGKNQDSDPGSGSGMNIPDQIFESLETIFGVKKILKFFDADVDADPGSGNLFDPGSGIRDGKKFWSGILDKHPESARPQHCIQIVEERRL